MIEVEHHEFAVSDGRRLAWQKWPSAAASGRGYVVALHGIQSHAGWYEYSSRRLAEAGFEVCEPVDGHLCCGSAGTYNILQPDLAGRMLKKKVETLAQIQPDIIATGNIGCMVQIASGARIPVVHTAELLDWATGGPLPPALAGRSFGA